MPEAARICHLFPHIKNKVLISLVKLCDCGLQVLLTKEKILVYQGDQPNKLIMQGNRSIINGMWYLQISAQNSHHQANSVYELRKQKDIVDFLAQAMWNPVPDT